MEPVLPEMNDGEEPTLLVELVELVNGEGVKTSAVGLPRRREIRNVRRVDHLGLVE